VNLQEVWGSSELVNLLMLFGGTLKRQRSTANLQLPTSNFQGGSLAAHAINVFFDFVSCPSQRARVNVVQVGNGQRYDYRRLDN
jgi:hypothetical protein